MKILSADQTRAADALTIQEENIASFKLMERAASAFTAWFENKFTPTQDVYIFCGPGNNGGDGLAIARLLHQRCYTVQVYLAGDPANASEDFKYNRDKLPTEVALRHVEHESDFPAIPAAALVIDALFGTGLNRPVTGLYASLINHLNQSAACIIAVDMPSGLYTDKQTPTEGAIIRAKYTVSFELPKLAFFLPQHEAYVGHWHVVPISLSPTFISEATTNLYFTTAADVQHLLKTRPKFSHKGLYGHALLLCGGFGKMGAAVLAARACMRAGVGLLTVHAPAIGYAILQNSVPEAMALSDKHKNHIANLPPDIEKYNVIGVGPGMGTERVTKTAIGQLLATCKQPLVLDADAINIIVGSEKLKNQLRNHEVILTPHPKEFERLIGKSKNDYDRLQDMLEFCREYSCYIVLKGSHTAIGTPEGNVYFNTTGNAGMATGGTGDVLTGIITALVAQKYTLEEACILGVYLHGLAADLALPDVGEISMIASDLIDYLPKAFLQVARTSA